MNSTMMIKQILDFNKKALNDGFNAVVAIQENTEQMACLFWEKSMFLPDEDKNVIGDWINAYKNGLDEFKINVDNRLKLIEDYLLSAADQMESLLNVAVQKADPVPISNAMTKNVAAGVKKAVPVKHVVQKGKVIRKKTNK